MNRSGIKLFLGVFGLAMNMVLYRAEIVAAADVILDPFESLIQAKKAQEADLEIDAMLRRLPLPSTNEEDCIRFMKDLSKYVQTHPDTAPLLFDRLISTGYHTVLAALLSAVGPSTRQKICQKIRLAKLLPPMKDGKLAGHHNDLLVYTDSSLAIPPGDTSLDETPFNNNHLPILWLAQNTFEENLNTAMCQSDNLLFYKSNDPIYWYFVAAVRFSHCLVVASKPLNCALFSTVYGGKSPFGPDQTIQNELRQRIERDWMIYRVPDSQYYVWVPKKYMSRYMDILNIEQRSLLKSPGQQLRQERIAQLCPTWMVQELPTIREYSEADPKKIFKPQAEYSRSDNKRAILDFLLAGHGWFGKSATVANIPVSIQVPEHKRLTSLLSYLNENLSVGTVGVISCSAGGSNKLLLQEIAAGVPLQYHYNLVLQSISDKLTAIERSGSYINLKTYFANAAQLESGHSSIQKLCKEFSAKSIMASDPHGFADMSQVLLPDGSVFTGCAQLDDVFEATEQALKYKMPLKIRDKQVALWYGADIQNQVTVYPHTLPISDEGRPPVYGRQMEMGRALPVVYPEFISMKRTKPILHFKHIIVSDRPNVRSFNNGILHFIRDAFLDTGYRADEMNIVIDRLEAKNDISWQIEPWRLQQRNYFLTKFEIQWEKTAGQNVAFEHVFIKIVPGDRTDKYTITLVMSAPDGSRWSTKFQFFGHGRVADPDPDYLWHFRPAPDIVTPTVATVGERLPSKGSKRFQKIRRVAGNVEQLHDIQGPLTREDYAYFTMGALLRALERSPNQALEFQRLIASLRQRWQSKNLVRRRERLRKILADIYENPLLERIFYQELLRDVIRARAVSGKTMAKKLELGEQLPARVEPIAIRPVQDVPQIREAPSSVESVPFE